MSIIEFIVVSFGVFRLSHGVVKENGPLMIWTKLRARLASSQKRSGGLFDMISCTSCISFWIALVASLFLSSSVFSFIGYAFALSGGSMVLEALLNYLNSLSLVARPAADNQITVGRGSTPEQGYNMVGDPNTTYGQSAISTSSILNR